MVSGYHRDECQPGLIWKLINYVAVGANSVLMKHWDGLRLEGSVNMTKKMVIIWEKLKQVETARKLKHLIF